MLFYLSSTQQAHNSVQLGKSFISLQAINVINVNIKLSIKILNLY
jgi:hypothetical protein